MALVKKPSAGLKSGSTVKLTLHQNTREHMEKTDPYASTQFRFSPCSKIVKGATEQLTTLIGCREGYIGSIRRHYNGELLMPGYSTEKTTLLAYANPGSSTKQYEAWSKNTIAASLALVNHFEREYGWYLSKAFKAKLDVKSKGIVYIFQGSRWWSTAPMTVSLYLLLIRLGRRADVQALGNKFSTDVLVKTLIKNADKQSMTDGYYLKNVEKWPVLLKNRAKIFKSRKFETNFNSAGSSDGIFRLTRDETGDSVVQKRFNDLC